MTDKPLEITIRCPYCGNGVVEPLMINDINEDLRGKCNNCGMVFEIDIQLNPVEDEDENED